MHLVDFHTLCLKGSHNTDKGNNEKYEHRYFVNKKIHKWDNFASGSLTWFNLEILQLKF